jgi:hypothetical protein
MAVDANKVSPWHIRDVEDGVSRRFSCGGSHLDEFLYDEDRDYDQHGLTNTVVVFHEDVNLRGQSMDAVKSQSLRSAVDQGLASGEARSAAQVLDRLEAKYAARVGAQKLIGPITAEKLHEEARFGKPIGKERR